MYRSHLPLFYLNEVCTDACTNLILFMVRELWLNMGSAEGISSAGLEGVLSVTSIEGEAVPPGEEQSTIAFCSLCNKVGLCRQ